jgi:hypothetical protein
MKPPVSKLDQKEHQHTATSAASLQQQAQAAQDFATPEDMLRHDAAQTPVPPAVEQRLQQSLEQLPPSPPQPWWRRWFNVS